MCGFFLFIFKAYFIPNYYLGVFSIQRKTNTGNNKMFQGGEWG